MDKWLAILLSSTIATIIGGVVVFYITQALLENDTLISKTQSVPIKDPAKINQGKDSLENTDSIELSSLLMIGKVIDLHPRYFKVIVTFELAPASKILFIRNKNGKLIRAIVQKRYGNYLSATSIQQDEIQTSGL